MQESLLITIDPQVGGKDKEWADACNAIGSELKYKRGPWGMGVFADYSCARGDHYLVGEYTPNRHQWRLQLVKTPAGIECVIVDGFTTTPPPRFPLAASETLAKDLSKPELSRLLALTCRGALLL